MKLDECIISIFGATGDLTQRKLLPSIFGLFVNNLTPKHFKIMAIGRSEIDNVDFSLKCRNSLEAVRNTTFKNLQFTEQEQEDLIDKFISFIFYKKANALFPDDYDELKHTLDTTAQSMGIKPNFMFYMSVPPSAYTTIIQHLYDSKLLDETNGWRRVIIEKPFGYDTDSAIKLNSDIHHYLNEHQIFRIDHYLGKETVQNLLIFRFGNTIFEPIWNRNYIEFVEMTVAESIGVEGRVSYYDKSGTLRDMFQNHMLSVLSFLAMESPASIDADSIRDEQVKVIKSLSSFTKENLKDRLVLAQYVKSDKVSNSQSYLDLDGVTPNSKTDTYLQAKLFIDNWRWSGVPFYLRTGKSLKERVAEIVIHFKQTPHKQFKNVSPQNKLIIRIQPDESIKMQFGMKKPGSGMHMSNATMDFQYQDLNKTEQTILILDAYQRLLLDCIRGDATLFTRSDFVLECWKFCQPIIDYKDSDIDIATYEVGSWGPSSDVDLLQKDGYQWHLSTLENK